VGGAGFHASVGDQGKHGVELVVDLHLGCDTAVSVTEDQAIKDSAEVVEHEQRDLGGQRLAYQLPIDHELRGDLTDHERATSRDRAKARDGN
jgi:hypothetical protein